MKVAIERLLRRDEGQDLVEYALLVAFVGLACIAAFMALENAIAGAYSRLDLGEQELGAVTPDPF